MTTWKWQSIKLGVLILACESAKYAVAQPVYTAVESGLNYNVMQAVSVGNGTTNVQQYTELCAGLNYTNSSGDLVPSQEQVTILPAGGAAAIHGQHQAYFPADIYDGVIQVTTPDGRNLYSRPLVVSYDDGSNTVTVATLTNSVGWLTASNQVTYPNCFVGIKADLVCTYRLGGFECDLVFRAKPPMPDAYGLDDSFATLQLVTEFFDTPDPQQIPSAYDEWFGLQDSTLQFGKLMMTHGKAFACNETNSNSQLSISFSPTQVYKSWIDADGRSFLVEQVPLVDVADALNALPLSARNDTHSTNDFQLATRRQFPSSHGIIADTNRVLLAAADFKKEPGVVMDYNTIIDSIAGNFTFQAATTYYISNYVGSYGGAGVVTIQGGSVLKFARGAGLDLFNLVSCQTTPNYPAIFTAVDDNTVGAPIAGSTGNPSGTYADVALAVECGYSTAPFQNLRIAYANMGLACNANVYNCQFLNVAMAILPETDVEVGDVLLYNVGTGISPGGGSSTVNAAFVTAHHVNTLVASGISLSITNSLFICVTNWGASFTGNYNRTNASDSGVFQTFGVDTNYLAAGSSYRNIGTTNIDAVLLNQIETMTTYGPQDGGYPDTTQPDLGYHYPSSGYINNGLVAYWKLNDGSGSTAADLIGGNNLILTNSPAWGPGYLSFNGSSQFGYASNSAALSITGNITICAWVNSSNFPALNGTQVVVEKGYDTSDYEGYFIRFTDYSSYAAIQDASYFGSPTSGTQSGSSIMNMNSTGQWYFLTCTYDGATWLLYVNGLLPLNTQTTSHSGPHSNSVPVYVGARDFSGTPQLFFNGSIHDVGIYNRALSPQEIAVNFLSTKPEPTAIPDLLYYKMTAPFEEQQGQYTNLTNIVLNDYSQSGAHTGYGQTVGGQDWEWNKDNVGVSITLSNSLHFNGNNSTLTVTNGVTAFNFTSNPFTVNLWVDPDSKGDGYLMQNDGITNGWFFKLGGYVLYFGSASNGVSSYIYGSSAGNTNWSMVTCVWDGTNASIYNNGGVVSTSGSFSTPGSSTSPLTIGVDAIRNTANSLDGEIWNPQIWSSALPGADIANLYLQQVNQIPWP